MLPQTNQWTNWIWCFFFSISGWVWCFTNLRLSLLGGSLTIIYSDVSVRSLESIPDWLIHLWYLKYCNLNKICVYIYIYIYIHIHYITLHYITLHYFTYIYIHIYIYILIFIDTCIYIYSYIIQLIFIDTCIYIYTYINICINIYVHTVHIYI